MKLQWFRNSRLSTASSRSKDTATFLATQSASARRLQTSGLIAVMSLALFTAGSFAQKEEDAKTPGELLPAEAVLYFRLDGTSGHEEAYAETAAYQALHESGLMDVFDQFLAELGNNEQTAELVGIFQHLQEHGVSLAIAVDAPEGKPVQAWATIVVPFAGEGVELLKNVLVEASQGKIDVQDSKVKGRLIKYIKLDNPLVELGWWEQGEDLVLAFGMNAISNSMAVADEERPNVTSHPLWKKYSQVGDDFDVTQISWLDFQSLRKKFGNRELPALPGRQVRESPTVNQLLEILGLQTLNHVASLHGYRGESLWTEVLVDAPGERTGLLSLLDQEPFVLDDLPAMPLHHVGVAAFSFNGKQFYETVLEIVKKLAALGPDGAGDQIDPTLAKVKGELGFAPEEFLGALGPIHCLYTDSTQSLFGLGAVGLIQVQDQQKATECLRFLLHRIEQQIARERPGQFEVSWAERDDRTVFALTFPEAPFLSPVISVGEDWLIAGLIPQAVNAQIMRMDGELFSWSIEDDLADSLEILPSEMTSLRVVDPAKTYKLLLGLAPTILNFAEMNLRQSGRLPPNGHLSIRAGAIPPAELVVQPLFMNVCVSTIEKDGWHAYARQSLPGLPLVGGFSAPGLGVGSAGVLVALLLPAVQNARAAAQRSQSKNNLKQLGLAMHNYHDVHKHFPEGTVPNQDLQQPEEHLSWMVSLLPFLEQVALFKRIDLKSGVRAESNQQTLSVNIPAFLNPAQTDKGKGPFGKTNYVGIGGLGENGPTLPVTDPKAGIFGYDRFTRLQDITDGTSNTIMIAESTEVTAWAEGGPATIRPFTKQPYLNGPDGIGSPSGKNVSVLFADGSVRTLNDDVDPKIIEAITTIRGGEVVEDF